MNKKETNINIRDWKNIFNFSEWDFEVLPFEIDSITSFRKAFWKFVRDILDEQKKVKRSDWMTGKSYYDNFSQTSNWEILINPKFETKDGRLIINTQVWFYESYHAFNWLRNWLWDNKIDFNNEINYKVLSAWVVMYHEKTNSFYLFKRPENSQEAPWSIDLLWGCMNTRDWVVDWKVHPDFYVASKMKAKAWLDINPSDLKIMWVQEFSNRWFYNLVYLYNLSDEEVKILQDKWTLSQITDDTIEQDKQQDNPGWSALTLALEYLQKK